MAPQTQRSIIGKEMPPPPQQATQPLPAASDTSGIASGSGEAPPHSLSSSSAPSSSSGAARAGSVVVSEGAREAAVAALAAAKEAASLGVARGYNKVAMTETRRFAGKDIQVRGDIQWKGDMVDRGSDRRRMMVHERVYLTRHVLPCCCFRCCFEVEHRFVLFSFIHTQVTVQVEKGSKEAARIAAQETKKTAGSGLDRFLAELDKKKKASPFICSLCPAGFKRTILMLCPS